MTMDQLLPADTAALASDDVDAAWDTTALHGELRRQAGGRRDAAS
jgi:hypothetical protein